MLMNHQKKDEHISDLPRQKSEEHIYVLPRQKVVEFLKALDERVKANPDVEFLELAIDTRFLKK
jgi:hypothetical protein